MNKECSKNREVLREKGRRKPPEEKRFPEGDRQIFETICQKLLQSKQLKRLVLGYEWRFELCDEDLKPVVYVNFASEVMSVDLFGPYRGLYKVLVECFPNTEITWHNSVDVAT